MLNKGRDPVPMYHESRRVSAIAGVREDPPLIERTELRRPRGPMGKPTSLGRTSTNPVAQSR